MAVLSFPVLMFVCLVSVHLLWYDSNPDSSSRLGVLPFLTYALASLSPASPSVRGLQSKSFQMASFPLSVFIPESISSSCVTLESIIGKKKNKAERGDEAMSDCWNRAHMCQHNVSIMFCFDLTPDL